MAIAAVFDVPGMTQAQYEQSADRVTGGKGAVTKASDWPVPGLISHTSMPTPGGEIIVPILHELGAPHVEPKIYPVHTVVTR